MSGVGGKLTLGNAVKAMCNRSVPLNLRCLHFPNVFDVCWLLRCDACLATYPAELHFWHWHRLRSGWNEYWHAKCKYVLEF